MTEADEDLERKIKEDRQKKSILQQVCLSIILFDSKLFICKHLDFVSELSIALTLIAWHVIACAVPKRGCCIRSPLVTKLFEVNLVL